MTTFNDFGLNAHIGRALEAKAFTTPTPVQIAAIPSALQGKDVMASAQTGTGKTAAFVLPALHRIMSGPSTVKGRGPRVLVLTPTRELAQQVLDNVRTFTGTGGVRTGLIFGGVSYGPQYNLLRNNLDLLVATPGRLIDHLNEGRVDFSRVETVVLDEADKMLDMGFLKPVERILAAIGDVASRPQMLLFSATFTKSVDAFAKKYLNQPVRCELAAVRNENRQVTQQAYRADSQQHKLDLLLALLGTGELAQAIIFSATKHGADKLAEKLTKSGFNSAALHGGMKQNARKRTLDQLHTGKVKLLVATDVAARGIDVKQLGHVINFDLPQVAEDYVHRIGRTGRAGETGIAISLISPSDVPMLRDIEKLLGKAMPLAQMPGLEPLLDDGEFARQGAAAPRSRQTKRPGGGSGQPRSHGGRSNSGYGGRQGEPRSHSRAEGRPQRSGAASGKPSGQRPQRAAASTSGQAPQRGRSWR